MGLITDILNLDLGLNVRNRLNAIIKFYNAVVKSDSSFNVERIDASFVKDATPTNTKFLRDDGTWQTVTTNQDLEQTLANGESTGTGYTIYFENPPILVNETQAKVMTVNHVQQLVSSSISTADVQLKSNRGIANGYASLDANGLIPSSQLPTYIDDVLEFANFASFPGTGVSGIIYVDISTNLTYRWSGTIYVKLTDGGVNSFNSRTGAVLPISGDYDTSLVADTLNKRYVTDAEKTKLANTSGTNTGDETTATIKSKLGASNTTADGYLTATDWNTFNNKGAGTIKGSVSATAGLIPTGTGVADTVTTSSNFIYNGTQLNIGGTTTGTYPGARLRINATGTSGNTISILDSGANSVQAFSIEENSSNYFSFGRYNSGWTGNFLGTSVPFSNSAIFVSGNNGTLRAIINGSTIVNLIGSSSSNYSTISDSTGVRIDTNNNIHTGNLNAFTVNGKSFFGGNISATAYTDINASTTSNASLRIRTGVLPATQLDGEINYVGTRLRHYNGADNTIAYLSDNATQLNTAAINVNVPADNSLIVVRKYKINSGIKLIVGSGGRFKVQ